MKILAIDYEGSSKEPRKGFPVQIGVAVMDGDEVLAKDEWIIRYPVHYKTGKPTRECDAFSLEISGLTLDRIREEGLSARESCVRLETFVQTYGASSAPNVAFNFTYDAECYGQMLWDGGAFDYDIRENVGYHEILSPRWVCAYRLARKKLGCMALHKLDDVANYFGLSRTTELHGALEDAILAGRVYHRLTTGDVKRGVA